MKNLIAAAALAATLFAPAAFASPRPGSIGAAKSAIKTDAAAHGINDASRISVKGDSFTVSVKSTFNGTMHPSATPTERVVAQGTINRATDKVTSYNPIMME